MVGPTNVWGGSQDSNGPIQSRGNSKEGQSSSKKRPLHESNASKHPSLQVASLKRSRASESRDLQHDGCTGRASLRSILEMHNVVDSPYKEGSTAEVGEEIFETFRSLLLPGEGGGRRRVLASEKAQEVFGSVLANSIVDANTKIEISGILYSSEWIQGSIRGATIGKIPKGVLLMLLQEQRFSRSGVLGTLLKIATDFELCHMMRNALEAWGLDGEYPALSNVTNHSAFANQKLQSLKCLVFIARVFHCMSLLRRKEMTVSLRRKVKQCLGILEVNRGGQRPTISEHVHEIFIEDSNLYTEEDETSVHPIIELLNAPTAITENSHVLFRGQRPAIQAGGSSMPLSIGTISIDKRHGPSNGIPAAVALPIHTPKLSADTTQTSSEGTDLSVWVPQFRGESILSPVEVEIAWLFEENLYCLFTPVIQWRFVWKYASPSLRMVLLKTSEDGSEPSLETIVRLNDATAAARFNQVRQEIRYNLYMGKSRKRMEKAIAMERLASHQRLTMKFMAKKGTVHTNIA